MNCLRYWLPAAVLVGPLGGCRHHAEDPAPALQGTWRYAALTTTPLPVGSGPSTTQVNPASTSRLLVFEAPGLGTAYEVNSGYPSARMPYGYQGGSLYVGATTYQVLRLSQQVLLLRSQGLLGQLPVQLTDSLTRVR